LQLTISFTEKPGQQIPHMSVLVVFYITIYSGISHINYYGDVNTSARWPSRWKLQAVMPVVHPNPCAFMK